MEWLLRPWIRGDGFLARAGRIHLVAAILTLAIVPSMILYFGIDGWWWDSTAAVCLLAPLAILGADQLAERLRMRGWSRTGALFVGFLAGVSCGYLAILLRTAPDRTVEMILKDYRRTMSILVPVMAVVVGAGASLWYRAENFRLESERATASFHVLRGQLQPHFLFNALNALKELIADDPASARDTTQRLADLYRSIMKASTEATAPLSEELAIVRDYLEIERVRFGERLRYRFEIEDELGALHVPSLMLQTLVENAVKHGVAKSRSGGEISVRARRAEDGALDLEVWNSGAPYHPPEPASGAGLANTRARLELMYGPASRLSIASDAGTTVRFSVSGAKL